MQNLLILIESNTSGTGMLIFEKARALGLEPVFVTNKPQRYKGLERFDGQIITCDTNNRDSLLLALEKHLKPTDYAGITTTSEFYVETVAHLTAYYGLPGNAPEAVTTCRHKEQTRACLKAAGVRQPDFDCITMIEQIPAAVEAIGLPCVVKPADDTGSYNVRLCNTVDEARRQAQTILAVSENVRGQQATQVVLVEAYLDAPEYSVEMFSWQGETFCVGITEKLLLPPPSFVEHRHVFPAPLQADVVSEMEQTVTQALATVGYRDGASHTEVKYTAEGSAIVEINARLAGGMIPELITLVTGLDLLEQQCRVASGQKPCLHADRDGFAGIQFLVSSVAGTLREIRGVEQCIAVDGITEVNIMASVGKSVTTAQSAYDRLGYVIAQGKSYDETVRRMRVASDLIEMHI